uniref:Carrier domain-containing protein n=1 Tax=Arcella intermedia TaxID=1963864 RepID=A0A6B2KWZ8_9EUKA
MGVRECDGLGGFKKEYCWYSYEDVLGRFKAFGCGLREFVNPRDFVAICSKNRLEWYISDYGCLTHSIINSMIPHNLDSQSILHIINQSNPKVIITSISCFPKFLEVLSDSPSVQYIIIMNQANIGDPPISLESLNAQIDAKKHSGFKRIMLFSEVEALGLLNPKEAAPVTGPDDIITLRYTSGSTGKPKGVVITDSMWAGFLNSSTLAVPDPNASISYSNSDRENDLLSLSQGARIAIYSGDPTRLFEDTRLAKVTFLMFPPSIFNLLYTKYQILLQAKLDDQKHKRSKKEIKQECLKEIALLLGEEGQILLIMTGGAPVGPEVLKFIKQCWGKYARIDVSYGITEVGGITRNNVLLNSIKARLIDWENYKISDRPYARGQLIVHNKNSMTQGYFLEKTRTDDSFVNLDKERYFYTGDIVRVLTNNTGWAVPDGNGIGVPIPTAAKIEIIDRAKNFFKLPNGEFVSPANLEEIFCRSLFIKQIFIHGDCFKSCLIGVVVLEPEPILSWFKNEGYNVDNLENTILENNQLVLSKIMSEILELARKTSLRTHEIPIQVHLETQAWTVENRGLTESDKINRPHLQKKYESILEKMYKELDTSSLQTNSKLSSIIGNVLNIDKDSLKNVNPNAEPFFLQFGGDSLTANLLQKKIESEFDVKIPITAIFGTSSLQNLSEEIERHKVQPKDKKTSFLEEIELTEEIRDLTKKTNFKDYHCRNRATFITGVTGFVGLNFLKTYLDSVPDTHKVYCLIRAKSVQDGLQRIIEKFNLAHFEWKPEYTSKIVVVIGSLEEPLLGLPKKEFVDLAADVDKIFHIGAQVNMIRNYQELKASNVFGTEQVILLSLTHHLKEIHYVSTIGVCDAFFGTYDEFDTSQPEKFKNLKSLVLGELEQKIGGYNLSKLISEIKLLKISKVGLPVTVCRPGFVGPNRMNGFANLSDLDTHLIRIVMKAKKVPIIEEETYLDLMPVDILVDQILKISASEYPFKNNIFHLLHKKSLKASFFFQSLAEFFNFECLPWKDWTSIIRKEFPLETQIIHFFGNERSFHGRCDNIYLTTHSEDTLGQQYHSPPPNQSYLHQWFSFLSGTPKAQTKDQC